MTAAAIIAACILGLAALGSSAWDRRRLDDARRQADTAEAARQAEHKGRTAAEQHLAAEQARSKQLAADLLSARAETAAVEKQLVAARQALARVETPADRSDRLGAGS